ncbi:MAG: hypothetical protein RR232_03055 [Clostridia bacterium]
MKKAVFFTCCIAVPICLAACSMTPKQPIAETVVIESGGTDILTETTPAAGPAATPNIQMGTLADCIKWSVVYDTSAIIQSDPIGPYTLSLSYDKAAQGEDKVTGVSIQGATVVSINGKPACRCEWGTEVTAMASDLTNDGVDELLLILCPIMDNTARCDVYVFSIDEATGAVVETLALAGSESSAFIDRDAVSYLHIPDGFNYPVDAATKSGVNEFCTGATVMEETDLRYLRIIHGFYNGSEDTGFIACSYILWENGWKVFAQEIVRHNSEA